MIEKYYYTNTMVANNNMWQCHNFADYMSEDGECYHEAEKIVKWSLDFVREVRKNDKFEINIMEVEKFTKESLKIEDRILGYNNFDNLRKENADIHEILIESVAEYLCGFRIRVKGYDESQDGRYSAVTEIAYWFQMVYGRITSENVECQNAEYLLWFFDTPIHGAWHTYIPSKESLHELMDILLKPLVELMRRYNRYANEVTSEYLITEYDKKSNEELLSNILWLTRDIENSSIDPNIMYMSKLLLEQKMYKEWIYAFEHLHYPILQGQMLCGIDMPQVCLELIRCMQDSAHPRRKIHQALIRQKWFITICKISENLRDDKQHKNVAKELKEETYKRRDKWQHNLSEEIKDFLELSRNVFGEEENVRWITTLPYYDSDRDYLSCRINNEIIDLMVDICSTAFQLSNMSAECDNLNYLIVLLMNAMENGTKDLDRVKEITESLFKCIYFAKTFTEGVKVTNDGLILISKISKALSLIDENTKNSLFAMFNIVHEGYDAHDDIYSNAVYKHGFILAVKLMLSIESSCYTIKEDAAEYFKTVVEEVFRYYKYMPLRNNENAYCYPLTVAMLIASQKFSLGSWFADKVIENVDNFIDVISILIQGRECLNDENIYKLQYRKDQEWNMWKIIFTDTSRRDCIIASQKMMEKLNLR